MDPIIDENIDGSKHRADTEKTLGIIRNLERILAGCLVIGYLFRIQHWPFSFIIIAGSFLIFIILNVIKIFFVDDKAIAIVKVLALLVMLAGIFMNYLRIPNGSSVTLSGLILYLSFQFFGNKKMGE